MSAGERPGSSAAEPGTPSTEAGLEGMSPPEVADSAVGGPGTVPLDVDGVRTVFVGVIAWAIAFVVLLFFRNDLADRGETWWLWTCLAGVGLGLLGLQYCRRRRDRLRGTAP